MKSNEKKFTLDELCTLVEMNKRKVRFYIQKGLVDRPDGIGKGASYSQHHLEQLLEVRKWKEAGLSLERIQELIGDQAGTGDTGHILPPPRRKKPGTLEVWSHLYLADGLELLIEPRRSGLTPEQVRKLCRAIKDQFEKIISEGGK